MKLGPIHALNGFPVWYKDDQGLRLELNTDPNDPYSGLGPGDLPDPDQPVSFPDNFPEEAFYTSAEAEMETGTGERAILVLALEAAFVNELPKAGEQVVFGRVRIRVSGLVPNEEYTVTHPYGVDTFIAEPDGEGFGEINYTEDIGGLSGGNFQLTLNSRVQPFLQWDPAVEPSAPEGYLGNPNELHQIIGSPFTDAFGEPQNFFRIEGPGIGIGSPDRSAKPGLNPDNSIETREFSLSGKISTISGVDVERTTYTQSDNAGGFIDIFAISDVTPQEIQITGTGIIPTILQGENGIYFARAAYSGETPPDVVTITNNSDNNNPASIKKLTPIDFISATADYDTDSQTVTIEASSSDSINSVVLTVSAPGIEELTIPDSGTLTISLISIPSNITISSTGGGVRTIPLTVNGSPNKPIAVSANAGQDRTVLFGERVTLDGKKSTGFITGYTWSQLSGEPVTLEDADTDTPSFTAPNNSATLTFKMVVEGEGGPSSDTVTINVIEFASTPVANAGPDQTVQQGTGVTLAGSATGDVTSYQWQQLSGHPVSLTNADTSTATLIFPKEVTTLTFELTATGPGGNSSDVVEISTIPNQLTVTRAEYRTRDEEWRISGTSDVAGPGVTVTIHIGDTLRGTVLAQVDVDTLGEWEYRIEPSSIRPNETRAISVQSSSGGTLVNIPLNVRK